MATSHAVSALMQKRAELAGQVQEATAVLYRYRAALDHVDATLRLFDPSIYPDGIGAKRPPARPPVLPDLYRRVLDVLRDATAPMTAREIARKLIAANGLDAEASLERLDASIGGYLRQQEGRLVESPNRYKRPIRWRVI